MFKEFKSLLACCSLAVCISALCAPLNGDETAGEEIKVKFMAEGVTAKVGGYRPVRAQMEAEKPADVKVLPEGLEEPLFGYLEFGDSKFAFIIDGPALPSDDEDDADEDEKEDDEGKEEDEEEKSTESKLYVDSNGDGDFTNDPKAKWAGRESRGLTMFSGSAKVEIGGEMAAVNMYRFDPTDPRRASLAKTLLFYGDFGYEYEFKLDGKEFSTFVSGKPSDSTRLSVDRNDDGKISRNFESISMDSPFNFTGTTYMFFVEEGALQLAKTEVELEQMPLPPDLRLGKKALKFTATTMDGVEVDFPSGFEGRIVMLDFWATWCGPCIREIPNMKVAYEKWHPHGFEILGISFDQAGAEEKINKFLEDREMPWPQVYEGKYWDTTIGNQHDVSGIPFVLLVDGDSGEILGTSRELRGEGLSDFVGEQLKKKFGDSINLDEEDDDEDGDDEDDDEDEDK